MQCFIRSLLIKILLGIIPVTAYADQKCYGDIIVFQRFDDQAIYPYFVNSSNDKANKNGEKIKKYSSKKENQNKMSF